MELSQWADPTAHAGLPGGASRCWVVVSRALPRPAGIRQRRHMRRGRPSAAGLAWTRWRRAGIRPSCEEPRDGRQPLVAALDRHVVGCERGPDTCRARHNPLLSSAGRAVRVGCRGQPWPRGRPRQSRSPRGHAATLGSSFRQHPVLRGVAASVSLLTMGGHHPSLRARTESNTMFRSWPAGGVRSLGDPGHPLRPVCHYVRLVPAMRPGAWVQQMV